jgi:two-component system, response regulator RegA
MTLDCRGPQVGRDAGLLVVDDDLAHRAVLQRAFERRGYAVKSAGSVPQALALLGDWCAGYAAIDLRLPGHSGLALIPRLKDANPDVRIVMMSGFASIATAIEAIKLGAVYYLAKPVNADMIERAFHRVAGDANVAPTPERPSMNRLTWEHIQGTLADFGGNISAAARALHMHRRTLQRRLAKRPARS